MKTLQKKSFALVGVGTALGVVAAIAAPQTQKLKLYLNGRLVGNVRVIEGVEYAPVRGIANAMGQPLERVSNGYRIGGAASVFRDNSSPKGGTYQIKGLAGKLGETLSDGVWQLTFSNLREVDEYTDKYTARPYGNQRVWTPDATDKLLVLDVLVKNIYGKQLTLNLARGDQFNTSMAGMDGSAVPLKGFDLRSGDGAPYGAGGASDGTPSILPGAQQKFVAIFSVPQDFETKDLIFSIAYRKGDGLTPYIYKDFRVALNWPTKDDLIIGR